MKKILFALFMLLPMMAQAVQVEINGINYDLDTSTKKAEVRSKSPYYSGNVTIPSSVTYSGETYSVTSIGNSAFWGCSGLTSIYIPNSVTSIGNGAFNGCYSLVSVTIPNFVTSIGEQAFLNCSSLSSISIPNSVTSVGGSAFAGTPWLDNQPAGLVYAGQVAYKYNGSMPSHTSITIKSGTKAIAGAAFYNCFNLESITIPSSVVSIGNKAFGGCFNLESISIPNSVSSIGEAPFSGCYRLANITVAADNGTFDSRDNCNAIIETASKTLIVGCKNTIIPNSVTSIGFAAFHDNRNLTSITIPNSITNIGDYAFYNDLGLTSLTIPSSVTNIGISAFYGCSKLLDVYCLSETPPATSSNTFQTTVVEKATLHVPSSSISAYSGEAPWSIFSSIEPILNKFDLVDGEPYTNTKRNTYDALTFSKTFASGAVNKWNALYVPINIDVASSNGEYDIAEIYAFCSTVDTNGDGTVDANDERFLFVRPVTSGRTYPNTPYMIRPREAKTYVINSADNILYEKRDGKVEFSTTTDKFTVTGLNEDFMVVANDNNYYVTGSGSLSYRATGSTTVRPNRWVMHREDREYSDIPDYVEDSNHLDNENNGSAGAKEYQIVVIGEEISEEDAIIAVKKANGVFTSGIYTIDGRKMSDSKFLPTGIYVKNGKKYIVK